MRIFWISMDILNNVILSIKVSHKANKPWKKTFLYLFLALCLMARCIWGNNDDETWVPLKCVNSQQGGHVTYNWCRTPAHAHPTYITVHQANTITRCLSVRKYLKILFALPKFFTPLRIVAWYSVYHACISCFDHAFSVLVQFADLLYNSAVTEFPKSRPFGLRMVIKHPFSKSDGGISTIGGTPLLS